MKRILAPGDAPAWAARMIRDIEQASREPADVPVRLKSFANAAALPDPARWVFGVVHVVDINELAFSDGTDWFPLTKGAAL